MSHGLNALGRLFNETTDRFYYSFAKGQRISRHDIGVIGSSNNQLKRAENYRDLPLQRSFIFRRYNRLHGRRNPSLRWQFVDKSPLLLYPSGWRSHHPRFTAKTSGWRKIAIFNSVPVSPKRRIASNKPHLPNRDRNCIP
jgi:hypothetical protein